MAVFNKNEEYKTNPIVEEKEEELHIPDFDEISKLITGQDEMGKAYATAYISLSYKDIDNLEAEFDPVEELSFAGPVFTLNRVDNPEGESEFLHVGMTFGMENTKDIIAFWKMLEIYKKLLDEVKPDDTKLPILSLLIKPNRKPEKDTSEIIWFLNCDFPCYWDVAGDYPGRNCNRINLFFDWDFCAICRSLVSMEETKEIINQEQIKARAKIEEEKKEAEEEMEKQAHYLKEMQERIKNDMIHAEEDVHITRVGRGSDSE